MTSENRDVVAAGAAEESTPLMQQQPTCVAAEDAVEKQIQQCLQILKGKRDEHKFAGLLMLTKLNDVTPERMRDVRRQVVDTVGASFFSRLLHTKGAEDGGNGLSSFQILGLNLIASFCADAEIAERFAQDKLLRFILDQLALLTPPCSASMQDCVQILRGMNATTKGTDLILQEGNLALLMTALRHMSKAIQSRGENGGDTASENVPQIDTDAAVLEAAWSMIDELSAHPAFWANVASYDFEFVCANFSHVCGRTSLRVLSIFTRYMKLLENDSAPAEFLSSLALSDLRLGVLRFLRSKWPHQERDECLHLIYLLMRHAGMSWMLPGATLRIQAPPEDVSDGKFVLFVLKLVSIEIKLMLDEAELALIQLEDKQVERVDEQERQDHEIQRAMAVLPICFGIVEMVVSGLVSGGTEDDVTQPFPYNILLEVQQTFAQIFTVVLELLTLARDYMKTHRYRDLLERQEQSVFQLDAIVYASVRVLGAWLAEDSDTCVDEVLDILPFLVCFNPLPPMHVGEHGHDKQGTILAAAGENDGGSHSEGEVDSDDEIDSDDEVENIAQLVQETSLVDNNNGGVPMDPLNFLLPGLLQISATPLGADVSAADMNVLRRLLRFTCSLCANISSGDEDIGKVPSLTLCLGILMNILLLRGNSSHSATLSSEPKLPNVDEWYRALSFLLPLACASGSFLSNDMLLSEAERGEDDRYVMVLHIVCVVLLVASQFQDPSLRTRIQQPPSRLSPAVARLVTPFNSVVKWLLAHPPDESSSAAADLLELCRGLSMRSPLREDMFR